MSHSDKTKYDVYFAEHTINNSIMGEETKTVSINGKKFEVPAQKEYTNRDSMIFDFNIIQSNPYIMMHYGAISPCGLRFNDQLKNKSYYSLDNATISIAPGWGMNKNVLIHEYAHHISFTKFGASGHGDKFVEIYSNLLNILYGGDLGSLLKELIPEPTC